MADPFKWTAGSELAAQLIAAGELTHDAIGDRVGISRQAIWAWRKHPDFSARVASHVEAYRAEIRRVGLAVREARVAALNDRWERLKRVIDERAADPQMARVAGGTTGTLVHNVKGVGKGDDFRMIDLYEVDTGTLKELREIEKQAAIELGQWTEKTDATTDATIRVEYADPQAAASAPGPTEGAGGSEAV